MPSHLIDTANLRTTRLPVAGARVEGGQYIIKLPHVGKATLAMHQDAGKAGRNHDRAGIPDFVVSRNLTAISDLRPGNDRHGYNLVGEVKTYWSYSIDAYEKCFSGDTAKENTGRFRWDGKSLPIKIIKQVWFNNILGNNFMVNPKFSFVPQVWSEMVTYRSNWAFLTNGAIHVFFRRDGDTLIAGDIIDWDDPRVLQIYLGLCCASIDGAAAADDELLGQFMTQGSHSIWN